MRDRAAVTTAVRGGRVLAGCALLAVAARAQVRLMDPLEHRAAQQAHLTTVISERALLLLELHASAGEELRATARLALEKARTPGSGATAGVSLAGLVRGARALEPGAMGPAGGEAERLQSFMDGLDVRAVPGVFEAWAGPEQRPEPLTLRVQQVLPVAGGAPEVLSAWWIAPDGREVRARRESVDPALLGQPFELFVHAPEGPPGAWRLVLQGERGETVARGVAISVEGVPEWRKRLSSVLARDDLVDGWAFLAAALTRLHSSGWRSALVPPAGAMLAALEAREVPAETPHPLRALFVDAAEVEHWLWTLQPAGAPEEPSRVVLLLAPLTETPELLLAGEPGRRWLELARAQQAPLYAAHLPAAAGEESDPLVPLVKLRALHPRAQLIVVARGDTWGRLSLYLRGREDPPLDALVISSPVAAAAPRELAVPWLLIAPGGGEKPQGGAHEWIDGDRIPLLDELRLPERLAAWLSARDASAGK